MTYHHKRLLLSTDNASKLAEAADWFAESILPETRSLIVAPTRRAADDFLHLFGRREGLGFGIDRMAPYQVVRQLAGPRLAEERIAPEGEVALQALASKGLNLCRSRELLGYFAPVAHFPGFPWALQKTLRDLRLQEVGQDQLRELGAAGQDLAELLGAYCQELHEERLADEATLLRAATGGLRDQSTPFWETVLLLDWVPAGSLERAFYAALAEVTPRLLATAHAADLTGTRTLQEVLGVEAEVAGAESDSSLSRLKLRLFREGESDAAEADPSFQFFSAPGEGNECVEIARQILDLVDEGVRFDAVAVLLRAPELHVSHLAEAFRRAGIPAYFSIGVRRPDPSGRAFLALLDCRLKGLSASKFAEYLSLGQVPPQEPETGEGGEEPRQGAEHPRIREPFRWEQLLVDAAVIGGADRWRRRLQALKEETRFKQANSPEESGRAAYLETQLQLIEEFEGFALPIVDLLAELPNRASWVDWLDRLAFLARQALRSPESVLEVLEELSPLAGEARVSLNEVRMVLSERCRSLRVEPSAQRFGQVFVGTIEEADGRSFRVVFLPGVAEGVFPRRPSEDPLLLDENRERLTPELETRDRFVEREQLLLQRAVAAATDQFRASFSRLDLTQGRSRVPSLYLLELIRAARGRVPDLARIEREAERPCSSNSGWWAPVDPRQAIDRTEFDLSTLSQVGRSPREETRGALWALMERDSHPARSTLARHARWQRPWTEVDGLILGEDTGGFLDDQRLNVRAFSPTALQHFSACPYRFYLQALVKLQVRESPLPLEQMDPLTRGGLFHAIQARALRRMDEENLLPVREQHIETCLECLERVMKEVGNEYRELLAPAIPQIWEAELQEVRIDLRGWLREMAREREFVPRYFEYGFGLPRDPGRDPAGKEDPAEVLGGYQLRGIIDLVEVDPQNGTLRITDSKTGQAQWGGKRVDGGKLLQPALYGLAAERLLERPAQTGRLYFCTRKGGYKELTVPLNRETREAAEQVLQTIDDHVRRAFLPAAPSPGACKWCDYRVVCGPYEEIRREFKNRDELHDLMALRGLE